MTAERPTAENKCYRSLRGISYSYDKTNEYIYDNRSRSSPDVRTKLSRFGHVCRHDTLPKIILQGTEDGGSRRERRRNHGMTTSSNGQASHCRRCCVSQTTGVYRKLHSSRRVRRSTSNDARASRELVSLKLLLAAKLTWSNSTGREIKSMTATHNDHAANFH